MPATSHNIRSLLFPNGTALKSYSAIRAITISCCTLALITASATAQVNGPGPSDPASFDTVINLPADQTSISGSIGNIDGAPTPTTQLNVADGGRIVSSFISSFVVNGGVEVNVSGGFVDSHVDANSGSELNISGGTVGRSIDARSGSVVNISGGTVHESFRAMYGSEVNISGGNVREDFQAQSGSLVNISGAACEKTSKPNQAA